MILYIGMHRNNTEGILCILYESINRRPVNIQTSNTHNILVDYRIQHSTCCSSRSKFNFIMFRTNCRLESRNVDSTRDFTHLLHTTRIVHLTQNQGSNQSIQAQVSSKDLNQDSSNEQGITSTSSLSTSISCESHLFPRGCHG